jgi:hypothetical protein
VPVQQRALVPHRPAAQQDRAQASVIAIQAAANYV